jgi:hypothetical protein
MTTILSTKLEQVTETTTAAQPGGSVAPELALLLAASRPPATSATLPGRPAVPAAALNWEVLLTTAKRHGAWPLLSRYLDHHADFPVPGAVRAVLQQQQQEIVLYNLRLTGELWLLLALLAAHSIEAIPIKGPTLAQLAFEDVAGRQFSDLDIFVDRRAVARASALLQSQGYELRLDWAATQDERFLEVTYALEFFHPAKGILVELHWALLPPYLGFEFDWARLRERLVHVQPGGKSMPTLAPDELLLYLCAHGAKHQWPTLHGVADVAWLIHGQASTWDWADLLEQARRRKLERVFLLGLYLTKVLFDAPVPDWLAQRTHEHRGLRRLARTTLNRLFAPAVKAGGMWRQFHYFFHLQPDWPARLRYGIRLLAAPNVGDWEFQPLTTRWSFLYLVLRPARLLRKYLSLSSRTP